VKVSLRARASALNAYSKSSYLLIHRQANDAEANERQLDH